MHASLCSQGSRSSFICRILLALSTLLLNPWWEWGRFKHLGLLGTPQLDIRKEPWTFRQSQAPKKMVGRKSVEPKMLSPVGFMLFTVNKRMGVIDPDTRPSVTTPAKQLRSQIPHKSSLSRAPLTSLAAFLDSRAVLNHKMYNRVLFFVGVRGNIPYFKGLKAKTLSLLWPQIKPPATNASQTRWTAQRQLLFFVFG